VVVRIRLGGGDLLCARFDADEIRRDVPGKLIGRNADAPPSCFTPPTTTTTSTTYTTTTSLYPPCSGLGPPPLFPICSSGHCQAGSSCMEVATFNPNIPYACVCVPDGTPACGGGFPTCGGACDGGNVCAAFKNDNLNSEFCACTDPRWECSDTGFGPPDSVCGFGRCPTPGEVCHVQQVFSTFSCGCGPP
jgi:hypothetical protein